MDFFHFSPAVRKALAELFGAPLGERLEVRPADLKAAFRARALETHPDRASVLGLDPELLQHRFRRTLQAYQSLKPLIDEGKPLIITPRMAQAGAGNRSSAKPQEVSHSGDGRAEKESKARPAESSDERPFRTSEESGDSWFYEGALPDRPLRIGEFLFYRGIVSWNRFIKSLVWQQHRRPQVGKIALDWKLISEEDLRVILQLRRPLEKFGECAVRTGRLDPFWVRVVMHRQGELQPPLGSYFVEQGLLPVDVLMMLLEEQAMHNRNHTQVRWSCRDGVET